jgi:hypothetical protein
MYLMFYCKKKWKVSFSREIKTNMNCLLINLLWTEIPQSDKTKGWTTGKVELIPGSGEIFLASRSGLFTTNAGLYQVFLLSYFQGEETVGASR